MSEDEVIRLDALREAETKRFDGKFVDSDVKYQIQFNAAKEALGIALIAQEKAAANDRDSTKEAINKAEIATDKRFDLLSEKIDGVSRTTSENTGLSTAYVTHTDLNDAFDKFRNDIESVLKPVTDFMSSQQGQQKGTSSSLTTMFAVVATVVSVGLFIMKLLGK